MITNALKIFGLLIISILSNVISQTNENIINESKYRREYFGQKPPGTTPEIFLPELFNKYGYLHGKLTFAPNGKEVFWVITKNNDVNIDKRFIIKQNQNGYWTEPIESFMNTESRENGPSYSNTGNRIYYQSRKNSKGNTNDINIFYRDRIGENWSEPIDLGLPINSHDDESQPCVVSDGSMFFCRNNLKTERLEKGGSDIYFSRFENGKYSEPICLGKEINSNYHETEPFISPDGSYLLFISNRPNGYSKMMNLYVSFKKNDGSWTNAECISHKLKIENIWFPTITYDGKYLFFCGGYPTENGYNRSHYYWVSTEVITKMNPNIGQKSKVQKDDEIQIICDNSSIDSTYLTDNGFSCVISFMGKKILFDTGNNRNAFKNNFELTGIKPQEIKSVFLSHNHSDHINGLSDFMTMNPEAKVFMSNEPAGNSIGNALEIFNKAITSVGENLVHPKEIYGFYPIDDYIYSTGFIRTEIKNKIVSEQALVINTDKGLVLITGCSHPGIVNIVKRAKEQFDKPIYLLLGGFHLADAKFRENEIVDIILELKSLGVQNCCPTHCTGEIPKRLFKQFFHNNYFEAGAGKIIPF